MRIIYKRIISFIVISTLCFLFTACQSEDKTSSQNNSDVKTIESEIQHVSEATIEESNTQQASEITTKENDSTSESINKKKDILHKKIINGNFTATSEPDSSKPLVVMWFEDNYRDYEITDNDIEYVSSASFSDLSDSFQIFPMLYKVHFSTAKPVPNLEKQTDGKYVIKVLVVGVEKDGKIVLSGFAGPNEFDEYDSLPVIYDIVSKDPRYSSDLKPFPNANLTKEFVQINMNQVTNGRFKDSSIKALKGGMVAVVCKSPMDEEGQSEVFITLFDTTTNKIYKDLELGKRLVIETKVVDEKLIVKTQKKGSDEYEVFYTDSTGVLTSEKYPLDKAFILYSPNKSKYVYSKSGSLCVVDVESNKSKILVKGNDAQDQNRKYYYPFAWIDDAKFIYGIGGYEWSEGCGIVDIESGKNTYFKQAGRYSMPDALINKKLYTVTGDMGATYDPGVIDLDDEKYPYRMVFKDRKFLENTYMSSHVYSKDGTKVVLLKTSDKPYESNVLYICSSADGSILKSYEFQTGYNRPQYLDFLEDGRIAIFSERYAFCAEYMYIVDVD